MTDVLLRDATAADWPEIWPIFREIVRAGDTYVFNPAMEEDTARALWMSGAPHRVIVAQIGDRIVATARMGPNKDGPGAHIGGGSYMVGPDAQGHGIGRAMVIETLRWSQEQGLLGVQFNAVAGSNTHAIRLYQDLGFAIIGTVPQGFRHPGLGDVDLHIMYHRF